MDAFSMSCNLSLPCIYSTIVTEIGLFCNLTTDLCSKNLVPKTAEAVAVSIFGVESQYVVVF